MIRKLNYKVNTKQKRNKENVEKGSKVAMSDLSKDMYVASRLDSGGIPVYEEDNDFLVESDVADFAFLDEDGSQAALEQEKEDQSLLLAKGNVTEQYDEWFEQDDAPLAWKEEVEDFDFKVVNFALNKNGLKADQKKIIAENTKIAKAALRDGKKIVVVGHCCQLGSAGYNMSLSEKRAKAVKDEMIQKGVPSEKIQIVGVGHECPIVWSNVTI